MNSELSRKLSNSHKIENYKLKYGEEEGVFRFNLMMERKKYKNGKQSYIDKFGSDGELIFNEVQKKKNITLENFIIKYGEEEGEKRYDEFLTLIGESWEQKKKTSSIITENETIKTIDEYLKNNNDVISHKLCGAGNGGFFLTFSKKDTLNISYDCVKINVSTEGVVGSCL